MLKLITHKTVTFISRLTLIVWTLIGFGIGIFSVIMIGSFGSLNNTLRAVSIGLTVLLLSVIFVYFIRARNTFQRNRSNLFLIITELFISFLTVVCLIAAVVFVILGVFDFDLIPFFAIGILLGFPTIYNDIQDIKDGNYHAKRAW